jgi:stage II sporulation protein P
MLDKKNTYNSLKYYIDIHRDSVNKDISTITINNKKYAKILFVIGLEHKNYQKNLTLATNINNLFNKHYKGLSRGIMYRKDVIFNQDLSPYAILLEVGGVDNTIEEINNTLNVFANILYEYLQSEELNG